MNALRKRQFQVPLASQKLDGQESLLYILEDDFADYMGQYAASLSKQTMKRLCCLFSYPHVLIASLVNDPNKKLLIRNQFMKHVGFYKKFVEADGMGQVQKVMMARHPLGTTPGKRCMLAFAENKPESMSDFEELLEEMAQGCPQTQIVEDIIGSQKNPKTVRN